MWGIPCNQRHHSTDSPLSFRFTCFTGQKDSQASLSSQFGERNLGVDNVHSSPMTSNIIHEALPNGLRSANENLGADSVFSSHFGMLCRETTYSEPRRKWLIIAFVWSFREL